MAADFNIDIALENKDYALFSSVKDIKYLQSILNFKNWGFVLDFKSAWKAKSTPLEYAKVMGKRLLFSHVSFRNFNATEFGINFEYQDRDVIDAIEFLNKHSSKNMFILETTGAQTFSEIKKSQKELELMVNGSN